MPVLAQFLHQFLRAGARRDRLHKYLLLHIFLLNCDFFLFGNAVQNDIELNTRDSRTPGIVVNFILMLFKFIF